MLKKNKELLTTMPVCKNATILSNLPADVEVTRWGSAVVFWRNPRLFCWNMVLEVSASRLKAINEQNFFGYILCILQKALAISIKFPVISERD